MAKRSVSRKNRCPVCHINYRLCFCDLIAPIETKTRVSIIIHVSELKLSSNTAKLAHRLLLNSDLRVRGGVEQRDENLMLHTPHNYMPYFLFPEQGAVILDDDFLLAQTAPVHLIVPDGSWRQAKKFKRREKAFAGLSCLALPEKGSSRYLLRKKPVENMFCTLEAISHALGIIEGSHVQQHLDSAFRVMVERTLVSRGKKLGTATNLQTPASRLF